MDYQNAIKQVREQGTTIRGIANTARGLKLDLEALGCEYIDFYTGGAYDIFETYQEWAESGMLPQVQASLAYLIDNKVDMDADYLGMAYEVDIDALVFVDLTDENAPWIAKDIITRLEIAEGSSIWG